jgi:hypothetical protein
MTLARFAAVLSLAFALHAFGQFDPYTPLEVDPPDPTTADSVTLLVRQVDSCPPVPIVVRSGFEIDVTVRYGLCLFPPTLITHTIELGTLPAGHYTVIANSPAVPPQPITLGFDVTPASSDLTVSQSVGSTAGGTTVIVTVAAAHCLNQPISACPAPTITFGGVPATNVTVIDQAHFRVATPPHAAGAVQVVVNDPSFTKSSYAFRYYDPQAAPSAKFFERVLIPVVFHGPGAFGSNWVTELSLVNANSYVVEPWRPIAGQTAIASKPVIFGSENAPNGLFLVVPRQATGGLTFHAAVRDTSRADSEWATQIPVVHETQFSTSPVELLDIPIDSRFRTMLRIYSPDPLLPDYARQVHVSVYSLTDGHVLREVYPSLTNPSGCSDAVSCAEHPAFVSVADLTAGLPPGRAGVQIQGNAPLWAFATVTNNDTQHVTVVSPQ